MVWGAPAGAAPIQDRAGFSAKGALFLSDMPQKFLDMSASLSLAGRALHTQPLFLSPRYAASGGCVLCLPGDPLSERSPHCLPDTRHRCHPCANHHCKCHVSPRTPSCCPASSHDTHHPCGPTHTACDQGEPGLQDPAGGLLCLSPQVLMAFHTGGCSLCSLQGGPVLPSRWGLREQRSHSWYRWAMLNHRLAGLKTLALQCFGPGG